ncbi:hypothetical protein N656DRAFT_261913 [Canariomyces notabilis]|uniref:Uncharacterized protein n=1 Tax=Canariomyces notabilis TaxID=2074819 RepID=A0AAN6TLC3_9PEZI|nr:hypothetical protein N656DRAFT_261913 [Canariomyces arenarius]
MSLHSLAGASLHVLPCNKAASISSARSEEQGPSHMTPYTCTPVSSLAVPANTSGPCTAQIGRVAPGSHCTRQGHRECLRAEFRIPLGKILYTAPCMAMPLSANPVTMTAKHIGCSTETPGSGRIA